MFLLRWFVRFLEEIEDTKKTFRNYLTFRLNLYVCQVSRQHYLDMNISSTGPVLYGLMYRYNVYRYVYLRMYKLYWMTPCVSNWLRQQTIVSFSFVINYLVQTTDNTGIYCQTVFTENKSLSLTVARKLPSLLFYCHS